MTSTVDEEIIRKRLLLDGEGAGDDRKLTMILKSFLKVNSVDQKFYQLSGKMDGQSDSVHSPALVPSE